MEFNFEGRQIDQLCNITTARGHELAGILAGVAHYVTENHLEFSFTHEEGTPEAGEIGIHKGKILKCFFDAVPDPQERLFVVLLFETLVDVIADQVRKKCVMEAVKTGIKTFFEKMHGKEQPTKQEEPQPNTAQ